jgi:predicted nucleic acid-binding protein
VRAYFDTSALLKLVLLEPGSETALDAWRAAQQVGAVSVLYVEASAGLAAARRALRLSALAHSESAGDLDRLWSSMHVVVADHPLCERAAGLAEAESLRGYEAVHLAAALEYGADLLVCGDGDLLDAALSRGLGTVDART